MKRKAGIWWVLLFVVSVMIMSGGCGGGGGGGSEGDAGNNPTGPAQPTNPTQPIGPTQPTSPAQPTNPTQPIGPTLPTNPAVSFESLNGIWIARNGSGRASGYGDTFQLRMIEGGIALSVVSTQGNEAVVQVSRIATWDAYRGQTRVNTIYFNDNDRIIVTRSGETFNYTFPSGSRIDVTVISDTTASVRESGSSIYIDGVQYSYSYEGEYYMDRQ